MNRQAGTIVENAQIADILDRIGDLIDLNEGNAFRVRSYHNAARTVRGLSRRVEEMAEQGEDLSALDDVGDSTAEKFHEILQTGTCQRLEELREQVPGELTELMKVGDVGPRMARQLYDELGVENLDDLENACRDHRVRKLEGMGEKTERNILEGIRTVRSVAERINLKQAADQARAIGEVLDGIKAVRRWEIAGSYRRGKQTVGDLDILVQAKNRQDASKRIRQMASIDRVLGSGREKITVRLDSGLQVDFRFFDADAFGAALLYFTGSKAHSIALRKIAQEKDWKLNEYGLSKNGRRLASKTEEAIYHRLNLSWIPPELREDRGELEAAGRDELPDLIEPEDIRGDLHCHTSETDGHDSVEDMAEAARKLGYDYLAITDHSKAVTVAHGLDEDRLRKHADHIREVDGHMKGFKLLAGVEVDILKRGDLDLDAKALQELNWVIASVHSYMNLGKKEMTDRIVKAVESGVVHCIGHPLGRMLGKREPFDVDIERIFTACVEHEVALEINAQPFRLDLLDFHCQHGRQFGVRFVVNTDAHKRDNLSYMRFGVATARRGWLEKDEVLNTRAPRSLSAMLRK